LILLCVIRYKVASSQTGFRNHIGTHTLSQLRLAGVLVPRLAFLSALFLFSPKQCECSRETTCTTDGIKSLQTNNDEKLQHGLALPPAAAMVFSHPVSDIDSHGGEIGTDMLRRKRRGVVLARYATG